MNQKVIVVAAVVDVRQLTLYVEDGSTIVIMQGDPRLRKIVAEATPQLIAQAWAEVTIPPVDENSYAQFEEKGGGVVKFFRVAKDKLKNLFSEKPAEPVIDNPVLALSIGQVPQPAPTATPAVPVESLPVADIGSVGTPYGWDGDVAPKPEDEVEEGTDDQEETFEPVVEAKSPQLEQTLSAVEEIMKHAIPASAPEFHENDVAKQGNVVEQNGVTIQAHNDNADSSHTIIAVVDGKVVPGMERIKTQFSRAAKLGSTKGVENFLKRIAAVIEQRNHSVEDLLKFMERGDLPIAEDGSILIYKVLSRNGGRQEAKFVDCHTKRVGQWTGAYVCMDPKLVDHNRKNECSNGLHVARRGYIRSFSGDVCVLAKLAPEDVIAVPEYDANKMRVCGYHILAELTDDQFNELRSNRPITNTDDGRQLLANAMAGNHIHRTHEVRITGNQGGGVVVTKLEKVKAPAPVEKPEALKEVTALENIQTETLDEPTNPLEVVKAVEKEQLSRKEQAAILYAAFERGDIGSLDALIAFKKSAKVGWDKLGVADPTGAAQQPAKSFPKPEGKVKTKTTKKSRKVAAKAKAKQTTKPAPKAAPKVAPAVVVKAVEAVAADLGMPVAEGSARERIQKLLAIGLGSSGIAMSVLTIKKASKKSWTILGVDEKTVEQIMKQTEGKT